MTDVNELKTDRQPTTDAMQQYESLPRLFKRLGVRLFYYHDPANENNKDYLDLTAPDLVPFQCSTLDEMLAHPLAKRNIAFCLLGCTNEQLVDANPCVFWHTPRYFKASIRTLLEIVSRLPPEQRTVAVLCLPEQPVKPYFDLDGEFPTNEPLPDPAHVRTEFLRLFAACFDKDFKRAPDVEQVSAEEACAPGKFSLHLYIDNEAFCNIDSLHDWGVDSLIPFTKAAGEAGDKGARLVHSLLDRKVWTRNRAFRLFGNCKPGKTALRFLPAGDSKDCTRASDEELLFRGLVNHSIRAPKERWLSFTSPGAAARPPSTASSVAAAAPRQELEDYQRRVLDAGVALIPVLRDLGITELPKVMRYMWPANGPPMIRFRLGTAPCPRLSKGKHDVRYHESNHAVLQLLTAARSFSFRYDCQSPNCEEHAQVFPIPHELHGVLILRGQTLQLQPAPAASHTQSQIETQRQGVAMDVSADNDNDTEMPDVKARTSTEVGVGLTLVR
jgi:hypothetical protein